MKIAPSGEQTTVEIKQLIVKLNLDGKTVREIAKLTGKSKSTVHYIIKRFRNEFRLANKSREGQGSILNKREERLIFKEIKLNTSKTKKDLKISLKSRTGKNVRLNTVQNTLHKYTYCSEKKPFIRLKNQNRILKFAKEYLLKTEEFGNQVILW